jgi:apolipoprotein D and lipocalin family protein
MNPNLKLHRVLILLLLIIGSTVSHGQSVAPLKPIANLDVSRYLGRWYEIAKFPNWFQKKCVSDTSADYALRSDGSLNVLNQCRRADGEFDKALGQARQVGGADSAQLQVRFAPSWLSFLPFVWGDYWVVDLDDAYELVAVSEPKRDYLWVLSRTPQVDPTRYGALIERLNAMGLETGRLDKTRHSGR